MLQTQSQTPQIHVQTNIAQLEKALAQSLEKADGNILQKATFDQPGAATSGLQAYDLEGPAKLMYPVVTPFRNEIPRVKARGGSQAAWRAITGVGTGQLMLGIGQGQRGGQINVTTQDYTASYKSFGLEANASYEAINAGEFFDDIRARTAQSGLNAFFLQEEPIILGGNNSVALGVTPTPTVATPATGGTIPANTYNVICVALTSEGRRTASLINGVVHRYTRTNRDGSTLAVNGGAAQKSVAASIVTTGATSRITASVASIRGAFAYAWFVGVAGSERLAAITGYPGTNLTSLPPGTRQLASVLPNDDASVNSTVYDGLLNQAIKSGNGGYWLERNGTPLTPDGAGGIVEFDAILRRYYDRLKMAPDEIWISSDLMQPLTAAMMNAGASPNAFRVVINPEQGGMLGGVIVQSYLNKFAINGSTSLAIRIHPNMPQGTAMFYAKSVPYSFSDVGNLVQVKCRQDYYQIEWPILSRQYEIGIYTDCVLQHYFPPSMMVLTGIGTYQEDTDLL